MYSRAIHLHNAVLSYDVQGLGSRALLMFHGAGQDRSIFHKLPGSLTTRYRIYAFDLFFHGASEWNSALPVSKNDWKCLLDEFCSLEQLEEISVLGYSIGARFALAALESLPHKVQACFLVAPDGLSPNPWFNIATRTRLGRKVFRSCVIHPSRLQKLLQIARRLHIVDSPTERFIANQVDNEAKQLRIFRSWTSFRMLQVDQPALRRVIDAHHTRLYVYLAAHDKLVAVAPVRAFLKRLKSAHLEVIDSNHRRVLTDALERMAML